MTILETRGTRTVLNETLYINNDTHLLQLVEDNSWPGSGTESKPYIISNYSISGPEDRGIAIKDTTKFIRITNCSIGMVLNGSSIVPDTGILLWSSSNITVDHCRIESRGVGISAQSVQNLDVLNCTINCTFSSTNGYGICSQSCLELMIANCTIRAIHCGIFSQYDGNVVFRENWITGSIIGIQVDENQVIESRSIALIENCLQNMYEPIIATDIDYLEVLDNHISNCTKGICIYNIQNGSIGNNAITDIEKHGLYAYNCKINILENTISDSEAVGIVVIESSSLIKGNEIVSCAEGGIDLNGHQSEIMNNTIASCSIFGIRTGTNNLFSTSEITISGNSLVRIDGTGIDLENSTSCSITNNLVLECTDYGVRTRGENDGNNLIHSNSFINNDHVSSFLRNDVKQATTDSTTNRWHGPGRGNFWSDLTIPDNNGDGIVDLHYPIIYIQDHAYDYYPLAYSPHLPGPPRIDSYEVKDEKIRLNWTLPSIEYIGGSIRIYRGTDRYDLQYVTILPGDATEFTEEIPIIEGSIFYMVSLETKWDCELCSSPYEMDINLAPPEVEITDPVDGSYVNDLDLTISWKMHDERAGLDHVEITVNDGEWIHIGLRYEFSLYTLLSDMSIDPSEGQYSISVRVYDKVGLHSTDKIHLFLDRTDPVVSMIYPEPGTYHRGSSFLIEWSSKSGLSGLSHYLVKMDEGEERPVEGNTAKYYDLEDGRHMFSVTAFDNAGNSKTYQSHFHVDNTAPYLEMRTKFPGNYSASRNILLEWYSHDEVSGLDHILIRVDSDMWLTPGDEDHLAITNLEEGLHLINILAYDRVGNVNDLVFSIRVDLKDPYINIHFPVDGERITRSENLEFRWEGMDTGSGISRYEVFLDGEPGVTTSLTHGSYGELDQGNHTLRIVAVDGVGRTSDMTVDFHIDSIKPTAVILTPVGSGDRPPGYIEVLFSEEMDQDTVRVWINGAPGIINWLHGNWLKIWPQRDLEFGSTYLVQISGGDLSGNYLENTSLRFSTSNMGTLKGRVVDANGNPIPNCLIYIGERTATSDLNGDFNLSLPSGTYTVIFTKPGFEDRSMEVEIKMGEVRILSGVDLVLQNEGNILNWKGYLNLLIAFTLALIMIASIFMFIYYRRPKALEKEPPEIKEVVNSMRRFRPGGSDIREEAHGPKRSTAPRIQPPIKENEVYEKLGITREDLDAEIMKAYTRLNRR